ncbi:hypothetical protein EDD18DRAFT_1206674 [Armillaria luteobubalina]|uniref:Uncharacterized protein n=1 Tax=Armillaria luteobubalina TaxID=153913 RepID=A0AA39UF47_9AGAR|nr:hypothetical protein EDD18DRAFT_1206674 [Armillaria luteobubalina]
MDNTTAQIPPILDTQTSSQEWADETKSALGSQKPLTPALPSAASTPGHDFPGAYPGGSEEKAVEGTASGGGGILETAKQYIPGQEDVGKALSNATETAKQYLPQAVVSYFPDSKSSESNPAAEGVDKEVPAVPDEEYDKETKETSTEPATNTSMLTPATNPALQLPKRSDSEAPSISELSTVTQPGSGSQMGTPPIVTPTANTKTMGVGDLPGPPSEENVAMLPEERNKELRKTAGEDIGLPASPPGIIPVHTTPPTHEQDKFDTLLDRSSPTGLHKEPTPLPPITNDNLDVTETRRSTSSNGSNNGNAGKKPKFMDKVKGEVKVLSGKLGNNESKIEEGRRLMGKV